MCASGNLLSLEAARQLFPKRDGKPPHIASIRRRIIHGVNGVRLQAVKHSGRWYTAPEWVEQYLEDYTRRAIVPTPIEIEEDFSERVDRAMESLSRRMRRVKGKVPAV